MTEGLSVDSDRSLSRFASVDKVIRISMNRTSTGFGNLELVCIRVSSSIEVFLLLPSNKLFTSDKACSGKASVLDFYRRWPKAFCQLSGATLRSRDDTTPAWSEGQSPEGVR